MNESIGDNGINCKRKTVNMKCEDAVNMKRGGKAWNGKYSTVRMKLIGCVFVSLTMNRCILRTQSLMIYVCKFANFSEYNPSITFKPMHIHIQNQITLKTLPTHSLKMFYFILFYFISHFILTSVSTVRNPVYMIKIYFTNMG